MPNASGPISSSKSRHARSEAHDRLVREIIIKLSSTRMCLIWENPTGAAYRDNHLVRYGLKGSADIIGLAMGGRMLCIEVKTGRAVQQSNQKNFGAAIEKMGGVYGVARTTEDALSLLKQALQT